jgi:hypothetical protein
MKTSITILISTVLVLSFVTALNADDSRYLEAMQKNIQSVYKAQSIVDLQNAINNLDRIASAEKVKWEPYYYASFAYVMMANIEQESAKKDAYLDLANMSIEKALTINSGESEIVAMVGFIHMMRVNIDPATRGAQYAGLAMQTFGKASTLNPENPRALTLMAQMQFGTAKFFGSPTTEACGTLKVALEKFESYKSDNPLSPQWGREMANGLKKECN